MQAEFIPLVQKAITFANLSDPNPEPGVTRLQAAIGDMDAKHFAVAVLQALADGGFEIVKVGGDA